MSVVRPNPWQWLRYAYGARIPAKYNEWVHADTTGRTWGLRHTLRALTQIAPAAIVLIVFVPGPVWIRIAMVLGGAAMALLFSFAYMDESTERRLMKAGYPGGTGMRDRKARVTAARAESTARLRAKREARIAARRR